MTLAEIRTRRDPAEIKRRQEPIYLKAAEKLAEKLRAQYPDSNPTVYKVDSNKADLPSVVVAWGESENEKRKGVHLRSCWIHDGIVHYTGHSAWQDLADSDDYHIKGGDGLSLSEKLEIASELARPSNRVEATLMKDSYIQVINS